MKFSEVKIN